MNIENERLQGLLQTKEVLEKQGIGSKALFTSCKTGSRGCFIASRTFRIGYYITPIMQELAQTYHRTWYFVSKKARKAVLKARAKLPEEERKRIQVLFSEVKLLGQPDDGQGPSEDLGEE